MTTSRDSLLWQHIQSARWYAGKGRDAELVAIHPLPWLAPPTPELAVRFEIAEVRNNDGASETHHYLLALSHRGADSPGGGVEIGSYADPELGEVTLHDATRDPHAQRLLLAVLLGGAEQTTDDALVAAHLLDADAVSAALEPRIFGGEQSNTSVMYGDVAMLKLFRRLELGRNLDIDVHRALADGPAADEVAQLFGWLEVEWRDSSGQTCRADAGMLVEQLRGVTDGWEVAVESATAGGDFTAEAYSLGVALRRVHTGLAVAFGESRRPGADSATGMSERLDAAIAVVPQLAAHRAGLQRLFDTLAGTELVTQRVHGDFHLGQTLRDGAGNWRIIDFEGEPLKTLAERREPDTVWRDVAGMLRSLDYAGGFAVRNAGSPAQDARAWVAATSTAFLAGYSGLAEDSGEKSLAPGDRSVVDAYLGDKAVYEVVYEARNRPAWLDIPLAALGILADSRPTDDSREAAR
ncbi:phosphotransferase [Enemella dayhoffiae]|uniref:Maltokinase n=1 Tax=Enemella dayhoffiae TaxID=2016507 RepID=A0A255GUH7_9ACTN|nr:hypothetical protein [Enemella dayhoffiae]OYO19290.1 phosphotransferase [Enemella dayhoffiae]